MLVVPKPIKIVELVKHGNPPVLEGESVAVELFLSDGIRCSMQLEIGVAEVRDKLIERIWAFLFDNFADADPQWQ